ncbi:unnamed protein product [Camellia sinensis]
MGSHPLIEDQLTKKGGLPPNIELPPRKHSSAPVSALSFAKLLAFEPILPRCRMRRDRTWIFTSPGSGSATNRLITAKDHASVQINVGHLDEAGCYTGQFTTFALCGFVRAQAGWMFFGEEEWEMLTVLLIGSGRRRKLKPDNSDSHYYGDILISHDIYETHG